ncbi:MAG: TIR domain-containing protein, partial [Gammaproteobacteria bacterium]
DLVLERPAPTSVRASGGTRPYHFISYSRVDAVVFGAGLREALLDAEPPIRTWFDQFDLPPGADAEEAVSQAVRDCESLLLVLTGEGADPTSAREWRRALKCRKPILLLKVHPSAAVPEELANRLVIDFAGDYVAAATELRRRLLELDLPVGRLRAMRECLDDAKRELARAADSRRRARIESDIAELRQRIAEQECTIARPAEAARRVEEGIERDLERERRPDREPRAHGLAVPSDLVPPYFKDREAESRSIVDFIRDPSLRLLLVHGHGGSGKTALVQRVLRSVVQHRLPDGATIDGIVYLSAVDAFRVTLPALYAELCGLLPPAAAVDLRSLYRQEK